MNVSMGYKDRTMGATDMEKLRLLMWKNFLQQWRHKVQSIAEILLPVLTASVIVILRTEIKPTGHDSITFPPIPAYSLQNSLPVFAGMNLNNMSVAYSPSSPILDRTVRAAVVKMLAQNAGLIGALIIGNLNVTLPPWFPNVTIPPDLNWPEEWPGNWTGIIDLPDDVVDDLLEFVQVKSYNNSIELEGIYLESDAERQIICAVAFDDDLLGATELPDDIQYTLRFPLRPRLSTFYSQGGFAWRTERVFPVYPTPGPRFPDYPEGGDDPGYVNEMFILMQHAISMELIWAKAPEALDVDVNIRRFPHPPYTVDMLIELLQILFPMLVVMSFTYTAVSTVRFVAREKELQLKESMKIMGLPTWLHWMAWFLKQFIFLIVTILLFVLILKMNWYEREEGVPEYAVFTLTPWSVIFMLMTLYIICTIFFCFMVSGLFQKASTATLFCAVFWFLAYIPALFLTTDNNASFAGKMLSCFSVNSAMALGFQIILKAEAAHKGMQWGEFLETTSADDEFLFGYVVMMLVVDCWLYMTITLYVEKVLPGPFGIAHPWYFIFQPSYWFPRQCAQTVENFPGTDENNQALQETDPTGLKVGVDIQNLTKVFNKHAAVNNLSLSIFEDQITVLLGHNGAGKTTTISMLTGMISPSHGTAIMAGHNILTNLNEARSSLGICPQHNVLFSDMTVREHLIFFSRIKGLKGDKLMLDVENLIVKLELEDKTNTRAGALSGGQQRRLCVGVALCGSPKVILLDEPTSGMDPSSRRALWDLLQREKKDRAVILTTHFMDEADILGDRIAIMSGGELQCVGSPFFLKQQYGSGYKLIIVKGEDCNVQACTELLKKDLSEVELLSNRGSELVYNLPTSCGSSFQKKLEDLEINQKSLGITSYGLIPTTLEDVFMKVGADSEKSSPDEILDDNENVLNDSAGSHQTGRSTVHLENGTVDYLHLSQTRVRGLHLLCNHVKAVWMKRGLVSLREWRLSLLQIIIPIVIVVLSVFTVQFTSMLARTAAPRKLTLRDGYLNTETLMEYDNSMNASSTPFLAMRAFRDYFQNSDLNLVEIGSWSIENFYLNQGAELANMGKMRFENVIGATFEEDAVTAWFSNFGYHDVAVSLATIHNSLLQAYVPGASIRVTNFPLPITTDNQVNLQMLNTLLAMQLSASISTSMAIVTSFFVIFYIKERVSRAKLLQHSSGIQPIVLWGVAAVFDFLWFMGVCLTVIFALAALRVEGFSSFEDLGRGYLVFMVFGASMLPFHYLASFLFSGTASGFVVTYFVHTFFGTICSAIVDVLTVMSDSNNTIPHILDMVLQFFPTYSLANCFRRLNTIGLTESSCNQLCNVLVNILDIDECNAQIACSEGITFCCVADEPYFLWESPGITRYINCMLVTGVILWIILMLIEYRIFNKMTSWRQRRPPPLEMSLEDDDVVMETDQVYQVDGNSISNYNLLVRDVSRFYGSHLAVNQVSFSVKSKECFGLLGVNGAGKTTTFKMLTGDIPISCGDAYVRGHSVRTDIKRVHENIGYCPQFDALFEELTGRETLRLYALLRGLCTKDTDALTLDLSRRLNFLKHIDKRVGQYSGGNKRKLSTAIALMGYASVIYLDEPTTGVDPAAKRQVWRAIHHSTETGRSVVLTSHSMEECEALCTRLAIMVNGRFQCFGSPQHLKNKFSQGYILTAKLKPFEEDKDPINTIEAAKMYITDNFPYAKLMESYQGLVTYYLPPEGNMVWSQMFKLMETAKNRLVEDYIISQTTLEQVFLQFAKFQKDGH